MAIGDKKPQDEVKKEVKIKMDFSNKNKDNKEELFQNVPSDDFTMPQEEPESSVDSALDTSQLDGFVKGKADAVKNKAINKAINKGKDLIGKKAVSKAPLEVAVNIPKKQLGITIRNRAARAGLRTTGWFAKLTASLGVWIIAIFIIIWILGIILAVVYSPALMKDGFVAGIKGIVKGITTAFYGAEGKVSKEDVYKLGDYARSKGFQLYADGFLYEKLDKSKTPEGSKYIPEEGIAVDDKEKITALNPANSPLNRYALMNAYTYTLENEQNEISKLFLDVFRGIGNVFTDIGSFLSGQERGIKDGDKFDGMIRFEHSPWNPESSSETRPEEIAKEVFKENAQRVGSSWIEDASFKLDMDKKTLQIKYGWFSNPYIFNIDGWAGRYGMPTEFLLALHKSLMAPDLIYEMTNGTKIENNKYLKTKMLVRLIKAKGKIEGGFKVPNDTSINGKLYDSAGNEINNDEIDFEKVKKGEVIYYAKTGTEDEPILFPLKTTDGPASLKLPTNVDELGVPKTEGEDDKYDITYMYISLEDTDPKVRKIPGFIINAETVKEYLSTTFNLNIGGDATKKANAFILNFGLHNLVRRYNEEFESEGTAKFADEIEAAVKAITNTDFKSYMPLIYKVQDHWFRDVYFYMNEGEKYTLIDEDEFIKKGEYRTKFKERNTDSEEREDSENKRDKEVDYQIVDKARSAYKIEPKPLESGKLNFKPYVIDEEDTDVHESIKNLQKLGDLIQIKEDFNLSVTQTEDGRRGETNQRTKDLFKKEKWYIYDGTENTANKINERRKENRAGDDELKRKLTKDGDLLAGSLMLENMESLDAEYAYRDYKELLLELDEYTVDDLSQRIRRVLTWPVPSASVGRTWPDSIGTKDTTEFGVKILTKENTEKLIEEELKDESGNPLEGETKEKAMSEAKQKYGEGFEEGKEVVSPVTGKIVKQEDGKIEILALNEKDKDSMSAYKDFYEDEYKGGVAGYRIIIQNINVGIEDKSMYKPQITEKQIERLSTEEQRKKVKEKEDRKKEAPNRVGEYIKEGTVIGRTTNEDIKIYMTNIDDEIVDHVDKYLIVPYSNLRVEILDDYLTRIIDGEANQLAEGDVESFKKMFPKALFPVINENAEAFLEMQSMYGVNAIFAAAVSLTESSGGTNFAAIPREYNNIFSMTGSESVEKVHHFAVGPSAPGSSNDRTWRKYKTVKDAILDFGKVVKDLYHSENLDYVSEIAPKYIAGDIHDNSEETQRWRDTTNNFITEGLKRYQNSGNDEESSSNNREESNENSTENNEETIPSETEIFETNPFDLLGMQRGAGANYEGTSADYSDSIFDGDVEYINGTYYFNQADSKWLPATYGGHTLAGNACGPFSSAIAFSAALGKPLDPVEIARFAASNGHQMPNGGSYFSLFPALGSKFGVPVKEISIAEADAALESGAVLILSQGPGYWTTWGHFITVVNKTPDGRYLVNDPGNRQKSQRSYTRGEVFNTTKVLWKVGPTEAIKSMQAGNRPPSSAGESSSSSSSSTSGTPGTPRAAFNKIANEKGLTNEEKSAWEWIINKESGWKVNATNPSSGAYGIPQALPGNKMASHGADWRTNPETQLRWMYDYMVGRYGSVLNAQRRWAAQGWY